MSRRRITADEVRRVVEAVVAEQPGRRDEKAAARQKPRYLAHGEPCCLVGVVLERLGFRRSVLRELDRRGHATVFGARDVLGGRFTPEALRLLAFLQKYNDRGWPRWGWIAARAFEPLWPHPGPGREEDKQQRPWMAQLKEEAA